MHCFGQVRLRDNFTWVSWPQFTMFKFLGKVWWISVQIAQSKFSTKILFYLFAACKSTICKQQYKWKRVYQISFSFLRLHILFCRTICFTFEEQWQFIFWIRPALKWSKFLKESYAANVCGNQMVTVHLP
jgi:hypothetical protein